MQLPVLLSLYLLSIEVTKANNIRPFHSLHSFPCHLVKTVTVAVAVLLYAFDTKALECPLLKYVEQLITNNKQVAFITKKFLWSFCWFSCFTYAFHAFSCFNNKIQSPIYFYFLILFSKKELRLKKLNFPLPRKVISGQVNNKSQIPCPSYYSQLMPNKAKEFSYKFSPFYVYQFPANFMKERKRKSACEIEMIYYSMSPSPSSSSSSSLSL